MGKGETETFKLQWDDKPNASKKGEASKGINKKERFSAE